MLLVLTSQNRPRSHACIFEANPPYLWIKLQACVDTPPRATSLSQLSVRNTRSNSIVPFADVSRSSWNYWMRANPPAEKTPANPPRSKDIVLFTESNFPGRLLPLPSAQLGKITIVLAPLYLMRHSTIAYSLPAASSFCVDVSRASRLMILSKVSMGISFEMYPCYLFDQQRYLRDAAAPQLHHRAAGVSYVSGPFPSLFPVLRAFSVVLAFVVTSVRAFLSNTRDFRIIVL